MIDPLHNFLARAAWLLSDCRTYLESLPNPRADALVERCDDFFSETYHWLKNHTPSQTTPETLSTSVPPVATPGLGWKAPSETPPLSLSVSPVTNTPPPTKSEVPSSNPLNGGTRFPPKSRFLDFF